MESFENSTLDLLIDPNTRQLIDELVDILFALDEAEIIKKIPLARVTAEDSDLALLTWWKVQLQVWLQVSKGGIGFAFFTATFMP